MDKKREERLKDKARKISIYEGTSYSLMDGFGLRYIIPYALALGANKVQIGLLSSLPGLLGNFTQIFTPSLMEIKTRKKVVYTGVLMQALSWILLILIGIGFFYLKWTDRISSNLLIWAYTLLILFGAISGPAWSSWMRDITLNENRGEYFGVRSRIAGIVALISMFIGGLILDHYENKNLFLGFLILFLLAFLGRMGSAILFKKQYEPKFAIENKKKYYFSIIDFVKIIHKNNYGRFVLTTALMAFAVSFASPFFSVYMLDNLKFSYTMFTIVTMGSAITALIMMPKWGKFADKLGNLKVIGSTGFLISSLPIIWIISSFFSNKAAFYILIFAEIVGGFAWAGYNLSVGNYIYDAVTKERMALCIAYFSIIHGIFAFIGATLGGYISSIESPLFGIDWILIVFLLSFIFRLSSIIIIRKNVKEVRKVEKIKNNRIIEEFRLLKHLNLWNLPGLGLFKNKPY